MSATLQRSVWAAAITLLVATALAPAAPLSAQGRLLGLRTGFAGAVFETWSFGDGTFQPTLSGTDSVRVDHVSQFSIPVAVDIPLGDRWSIDLATAYATGRVSLAQPDSSLGTDHYALNGLTDVRIRATGRVIGESVVFTLGANLPTGQTSLDAVELSALRVLAAPALSVQAPTLGTGPAGTAGLVVARPLGSWAWAFGASYEVRAKYSPIAIAAGIPTPDFNPSDALRVSLGADGLVGQSGMTIGVSADFYTEDRLRLSTAPGAAITPQSVGTQLGPILTGEWQLRVATSRFRELTFYAVDRYRTRYKRDGERIDGSNGNYFDAGVRSVFAAARSTGILAALALRHHTGLKSDNTIATAAFLSGVLTLGTVHDLRGGYSLQPFVRGQLGRLKSGARSTSATGFAGGVTLGLRF